ncbi:MAG: CBS and ACT domain-containing protein [Proteobacteria bacterium]|nr:CBS and ACT domain-containing protein [Pseudomonadota bacterium]MBU1386648.1 CBS and ACT domain-containing protein [Pseudomonadota bacterium]MBU1543259.1 CBS and ACT domain-containing protein [Pseudomonadota bacterium]MBU2482171.1 CBS and ACT domain-containing protein [Pseudomonadota bacterium]
MLIREWMSKPVLTIDHQASLSDAVNIFKSRVISMLPVMEAGEVVGVVTDGDIKKASPSDATTLDRFEMISLMDNVKIKSVMSSPAISIQSDHTVDEAANIMLGKGISGMPVTDRLGKLEGVITKSDIFRCLVSFTGVANKGQVFAFRLQDKPGVIKTITDMIRNSGGRLCSVLTSHDDIEDGFRKVFVHVFDIIPEEFDRLRDQFLRTGDLYYFADLSRDYRTIC